MKPIRIPCEMTCNDVFIVPYQIVSYSVEKIEDEIEMRANKAKLKYVLIVNVVDYQHRFYFYHMSTANEWADEIYDRLSSI